METSNDFLEDIDSRIGGNDHNNELDKPYRSHSITECDKSSEFSQRNLKSDNTERAITNEFEQIENTE